MHTDGLQRCCPREVGTPLRVHMHTVRRCISMESYFGRPEVRAIFHVRKWRIRQRSKDPQNWLPQAARSPARNLSELYQYFSTEFQRRTTAPCGPLQIRIRLRKYTVSNLCGWCNGPFWRGRTFDIPRVWFLSPGGWGGVCRVVLRVRQ